MNVRVCLSAVLAWALVAGAACAQDPPPAPAPADPPAGAAPGPRRPDGGPGPGFPRFTFPLLDALDVNQDGKLSKEEIEGAVAALRKLDKNQDGKLSREEIGWPPAGMGRRGRGGPGPARPPAADPGSSSSSPPVSFVERIMSHDKDGDGKVTEEELPDRMKWMVRRLDTNQDGAIDKAEAEAAATPLSQRKKE